MVVCALDSDVYNCGFADRLRGILSGYAYAKINNLPFKIIHKNPYLLEDYLKPNSFDWTNKNGVRINFWLSDIIVSLNDLQTANKLFKHKTNKPLYLFTNNNLLLLINQHYGTDYHFSELFNELFRPSDILDFELSKCFKKLGRDYISISFRFLDLLGDSFEGNPNSLPEWEKEDLITKCIAKINEIQKKEPSTPKILVTADSMVFLQRIKGLNDIYVIPGQTGHSGFKGSSDIMMKTFLDFIVISQAKKVYLVKGPGMYQSHFASSAAQIQDRPFEIISF